jgi:hypothetical protein
MKKKTGTSAGRGSHPIYQLKVVLLDTEPPVWRLVQVPGHANLGWLHAVLQVAMGWTNSHLHLFSADGERYSDPGHNDDVAIDELKVRDEAEAGLMQIAPGAGARFNYEYDFGDSWNHEITVAKILPHDTAIASTAICLDGARSCPPEDSGGTWGYANLLEVLKNPKHPEHKSMKEWLDRTFDAETFDVAKTNLWLRKLKWPQVTDTQLRRVLMGRDGYRE